LQSINTLEPIVADGASGVPLESIRLRTRTRTLKIFLRSALCMPDIGSVVVSCLFCSCPLGLAECGLDEAVMYCLSCFVFSPFLLCIFLANSSPLIASDGPARDVWIEPILLIYLYDLV
jgi:hypothetical protein